MTAMVKGCCSYDVNVQFKEFDRNMIFSFCDFGALCSGCC